MTGNPAPVSKKRNDTSEAYNVRSDAVSIGNGSDAVRNDRKAGGYQDGARDGLTREGWKISKPMIR